MILMGICSCFLSFFMCRRIESLNISPRVFSHQFLGRKVQISRMCVMWEVFVHKITITITHTATTTA
jgi:hypothetical protein